MYKEAGHLFKEYGPDVGKSMVTTTANNINQSQQQKQQQQQQQQLRRRDPKFLKSLGDDFKKFAHGAEHVAEAVAPFALQYGPKIAMGLMARDLELSARDLEALEALEARDPNFWNTIGNDFKKAATGVEHVAKTVGPTVSKYAPEIAGAVLMARNLDALEARFLNAGEGFEGAARDLDVREARNLQFSQYAHVKPSEGRQIPTPREVGYFEEAAY